MKTKVRQQLRSFKEKIERRLDREQRNSADDGRPVLRGTGALYEISERVRAVAAGGVGLMQRLAQAIGLDKEIDKEEFSPKRWAFITKNARSDLSQEIGQLNDVPVLLLTGARDGQLDAVKTDATFKKLLGEKLVRHQFETAGHSMIQVDQRKPMDGFDGFWVLLKVGFMGQDAFVEGYWAAMDEFIAAVLN